MISYIIGNAHALGSNKSLNLYHLWLAFTKMGKPQDEEEEKYYQELVKLNRQLPDFEKNAWYSRDLIHSDEFLAHLQREIQCIYTIRDHHHLWKYIDWDGYSKDRIADKYLMVTFFGETFYWEKKYV